MVHETEILQKEKCTRRSFPLVLVKYLFKKTVSGNPIVTLVLVVLAFEALVSVNPVLACLVLVLLFIKQDY